MRKDGWETAFFAEIEAAQNRALGWGEFDCVTWAGNMTLALTGFDPIAEFRGRYRSKAGAYRLIRETAGTLAECVDRKLQRISVSRAGRGDVVLIDNALGVCAGVQSLFVTENHGLQGLPTLNCEAAWRVE
jgi:hypothetical protein